MLKIKPLKKFGQNYLTDNNILNKIVKEISPSLDDNLIEIGPGLGALTGRLISFTPNMTAIEIDTRVVEDLALKFPELRLIHSDFLKINLKDLFQNKNKKLRIVGNIPYNLTSPILFKMINASELIYDSILMVQLEVAKRMIAKKGVKDYGILAVLIQHFAEVNLCFKVSANVFYPKPKVDSAVIHLNFKEEFIDKNKKEIFIQIVKAAFGNRRKTLKNSLANSIFAEIDLPAGEFDMSRRAEELTIDDFVHLAKLIGERTHIR